MPGNGRAFINFAPLDRRPRLFYHFPFYAPMACFVVRLKKKKKEKKGRGKERKESIRYSLFAASLFFLKDRGNRVLLVIVMSWRDAWANIALC